MKKGTFGLTHDDLTLLQAALSITFSPRARNRVVCNQLPHLGPISRKQASAIRSSFGDMSRSHK